ncbi:MAG: hypothetical protein RJB11_3269 [Planctomycetota bacterium]|jgi:hypothetical protein
MTDPVVAEIRATRERLAEESGWDIHAIAEAARKRQHTSGVKTVSRSKLFADPSLDKPVPLECNSIESGSDTSTFTLG